VFEVAKLRQNNSLRAFLPSKDALLQVFADTVRHDYAQLVNGRNCKESPLGG